MMPARSHDQQRAADAAFFEDWSEWTALDDLPEQPRNSSGHALRWGEWYRSGLTWSRYHLALRRRIDWIGGPAFELALPNSSVVAALAKRLPGVRQHPGLWGINSPALHGLRDTWFIPAEHWRALRAAMPAIKASVLKYVETH